MTCITGYHPPGNSTRCWATKRPLDPPFRRVHVPFNDDICICRTAVGKSKGPTRPYRHATTQQQQCLLGRGWVPTQPRPQPDHHRWNGHCRTIHAQFLGGLFMLRTTFMNLANAFPNAVFIEHLQTIHPHFVSYRPPRSTGDNRWNVMYGPPSSGQHFRTAAHSMKDSPGSLPPGKLLV